MRPDPLPPIPAAKQHELMTLDGFMMYLLSPEGAALDPAHTGVFQDMNQPLAHYFISSSHNTYLTDSQIGGPSSTEAYVRYHGGGQGGCGHVWEPSLGAGMWGSTPTVGFLGRGLLSVALVCATHTAPCPSFCLSPGPLPRDAAAWSWTAGRGQEGSLSSTTATPSPPRSSSETWSRLCVITPSR